MSLNGVDISTTDDGHINIYQAVRDANDNTQLNAINILTTAEIEVLDGAVAGTQAAGKVVIPDSNINIGVVKGTEVHIGATGSEIEVIIPTSATPVNAVAASGVLTISGVAIDGETITIGDDSYEFAADTAQSISEDFAIDITSYTTASQGTLTVDTQVTATDTMTIGSKVFTFVADGTESADGDISVGTDLATGQANIVAAINGTDGINTPHTLVSAAAFATNDCVITALIGGTAGDTIATTETFTTGTNVFDAVTLGTTTAGVDCTAANAVTAIVTSVTANDTQGVGAADGAGDTVDLTADIKGTAANSIATTETMANGSFGAVTLESGVDGTVGTASLGQFIHYDSSYLYYLVGDNTIADTNWRRVALGSAY